MNLKKLTLEEYQSRKPKSYLEESLENGTAEYYIVNYNEKEYQFFFYKKTDDIAKIHVEENSSDALFDYEDVMQEIFTFLKEQGFKKVKITLMDEQEKRKTLALKYGFKEEISFKQGDWQFTDYSKDL